MIPNRPPWLLVLAAVGTLVAAAAPWAHAQPQDDARDQTLRMRADDEVGSFFFTVDGVQDRNPALAMEPGATVTVEIENVGSTIHNLHFGDPVDGKSRLLYPDEVDTVTFSVPDRPVEAGYVFYWCDPHRALGMIGSVSVAERPGADEAPAEATAATPEVTVGVLVVLVVLVAIGFAVVRRRA